MSLTGMAMRPMNESDSSALARRAALFQQLVLRVACGPGGMIICFPCFDTRRPFQEGEPLDWYSEKSPTQFWGPDSPTPTPAEWPYGENTLWATGWFLWSQMLRYQVTGESEALANARSCFRSFAGCGMRTLSRKT